MAHARFSSSRRRGSLLHDDIREIVTEFASVVIAIFTITATISYFMGIDLHRILNLILNLI